MATAMVTPRIQKRLPQRAVDIGGAEHHIRHQVIKPLRLKLTQRRASQALGVFHFDRRQKRQGDFWKPPQFHFAAHPREG